MIYPPPLSKRGFSVFFFFMRFILNEWIVKEIKMKPLLIQTLMNNLGEISRLQAGTATANETEWPWIKNLYLNKSEDFN